MKSDPLPLFSVLTPSYNRASTLHRVYESLSSQTLQGVFEWVVVDDGSKDETQALVEGWQKEANFPILYLAKKNGGKISALLEGLSHIQGELLLIADSDDRFLPQTLETFHALWQGFTQEEKNRCSGIGVLCLTQEGKPLGRPFPKEGWFEVYDSMFDGTNDATGETWSALNASMLKRHFSLPKEAEGLKFIPESFFWVKLAIHERPKSYRINQPLRIYYVNEEGTGALSENIRLKQPRGFLFESRYFLNHYPFILKEYPRSYLKHLLKYALFSRYLGDGFLASWKNLTSWRAKILFALCYLPAFALQKRYFHP